MSEGLSAFELVEQAAMQREAELLAENSDLKRSLEALQQEAYRLQWQAGEYLAERENWKTRAGQSEADAVSYANAWQREIAGYLRPKRHHIDMLVVSTRGLVERCKQAERRAHELAHVEEAARSLGYVPAARPVASLAVPVIDQTEPCALSHLAMVLDKLEAADHPSRELDELVATAVGNIEAPTPSFTSSFEAALQLVEAGGIFEVTVFGNGPDGKTYTCCAIRWWTRPDDNKSWRSKSGNKLDAALALCIAALKVRVARAEQQPALSTADSDECKTAR